MRSFSYTIFLFLAIMAASVDAKAYLLPWGLTATAQLRWEDDRLDADPSVGKSRLCIRKLFEIGKVSIAPNAYYEYQSYNSFLSGNSFKEADMGVLFDIVALNSDAIKLTISPGYEYQDNLGGNKDGLMVLQLKADLQ